LLYIFPRIEVWDLKKAVSGELTDDSFNLDFYRISIKNQTLNWAYIADMSDLKNDAFGSFSTSFESVLCNIMVDILHFGWLLKSPRRGIKKQSVIKRSAFRFCNLCLINSF